MEIKNVPVKNGNWIDYKGKVYVMKVGAGPYVKYQCDGTSCTQRETKAFLKFSFKSDSKWFDPEFWYQKTCWGTRYPNRLYFDNPKKTLFGDFNGDFKFPRKVDISADALSISADDILCDIITAVNIESGKIFQFTKGDSDYGVHWSEAHIPVELDGKEYIITWENCD